MHKKIFPADITQLSQTLLWIEEHLMQNGRDAKTTRRIELALEEALVNIIHYAYPHKKGLIEITLLITPCATTIQIRDWGKHFDPSLYTPVTNPHTPLEEKEIGGLGIHFIRQIMDQISYAREQNTNILTLIKKTEL